MNPSSNAQPAGVPGPIEYLGYSANGSPALQDSDADGYLSPAHRRRLVVESGLSENVIAARGYQTVTAESHEESYRVNGWHDLIKNLPALEIPLYTTAGKSPYPQLRPDDPQTDARGRAKKYIIPTNASVRIDVHPSIRERVMGTEPLIITEGIIKADSAVSRGLCCIALLGVWNFRGRNSLGGFTALADWDDINLKNRDVYICFDSDVTTKSEVRRALERLRCWLTSRGARVKVVVLPQGPTGEKVGLDDYFVAGHTVADFWALAREASPIAASTGRKLELRAVSSIQPEAVEALWRSRILRGKLNLLVGNPGVGKSFVSLAIAAAVSGGTPLPDNVGTPPGSVIILNFEDGAADTIRPRAERIGANLHKLHIPEVSDGEARAAFKLSDVELLKEAVEEVGDVALIIVDPIMTLLGGVDSARDNEVRASLQPLVNLAEETGVAVLGVMHLRKADADVALYRVGGSIGFVGLARSVLLAGVDSETGRHAIASVKNNLSAPPDPIGYSIDNEGQFWWGHISPDLTADYLLGPKPKGGRRESAIRQAEAFLRRELGDGPKPSKEVFASAHELGIAKKTLERAVEKIGVRSEKDGMRGPWRMSLSDEPDF